MNELEKSILNLCVLVAIAGICFGCLLGCALGCILGKSTLNDFQAKAVEKNAAEWVVDPKTGKTTFSWKDD